MEALNLMIPKSTKNHKIHRFQPKIHGFWAFLMSESAPKLQNLQKKPTKFTKIHKIQVFRPKIHRFCSFCVFFWGLEVENCQLVLSPERGSKGETSIFLWKSAKTTKSPDFGQI